MPGDFDMNLAKFIKTDYSLLAYCHDKLIFRSRQTGIKPVIDYLRKHSPPKPGVVFFDKIVGHCAALLLIKARAKKVYSPKISTSGLRVFKRYRIPCFYLKKIPRVLNIAQTGSCPMERLSFKKSPEQIYKLLLNQLNRTKTTGKK